MRKVTASAVILTALTSCGQNSGIPSTQWSFEVPSEDGVGSLELGTGSGGVSGTTLVSAAGGPVLFDEAATDTFDAVPGQEMMGPAFQQPGLALDASDSKWSAKNSQLGRSSSSSSAVSVDLGSGYSSLASRPDPVAQVKAFLSAHGSPSALTNREPYRSDVLVSSVSSWPTVAAPPAPTVTAMLGSPFGMEMQTAPDFTEVGLPVVDALAGGVYGSASSAIPEPSASAGSISSGQDRPIYQPFSYSALPAESTASAMVSSGEGSAAETVIAGADELAADGLPRLEPMATSAEEVSIGTAILRDIRETEIAQAVPTQDVANGSIDIAVVPASTGGMEEDSTSLLSAGSEVAGSEMAGSGLADREVSGGAIASLPTLEGLQRSVLARDSELVAYASQAGGVDAAVEAVAVSTRNADSPTLERLLETMPETAAQANFAADVSSNRLLEGTSPLLDGLSGAEPLSNLYMPISGMSAADGTDTSRSMDASLVRSSLALLTDRLPAATASRDSRADILRVGAARLAGFRGGTSGKLSQRSKSVLSLVEKPLEKSRQLIAY